MKAYLYGRHSTLHQSATELVQRRDCERYYTEVLAPKGFGHGGWHYDDAVSGGKPFTERPNGAAIWVLLQRGDCILPAGRQLEHHCAVQLVAGDQRIRYLGPPVVAHALRTQP
jgi:hypothetical protein